MFIFALPTHSSNRSFFILTSCSLILPLTLPFTPYVPSPISLLFTCAHPPPMPQVFGKSRALVVIIFSLDSSFEWGSEMEKYFLLISTPLSVMLIHPNFKWFPNWFLVNDGSRYSQLQSCKRRWRCVLTVATVIHNRWNVRNFSSSHFHWKWVFMAKKDISVLCWHFYFYLKLLFHRHYNFQCYNLHVSCGVDAQVWQ